jgi:hypothetical protein
VSENIQEQYALITEKINTKRIALVIDNQVVQVLRLDEKLFSILASDPVMVDVTDRTIGKTADFSGTYYDEENNKFIPLQKYPSWKYDDNTEEWHPPVPKPEESDGITFAWDEERLNWVNISEYEDNGLEQENIKEDPFGY